MHEEMEMTEQQATLEGLAEALDRTGALVAAVPPDAAHAPTPCASWDVEHLVEHLVQDLRHFTSTASGQEWDPSRAEDADGGGAAAYDGAAEALLEAWRRGGVQGRMLHLRIGDVPSTWAIGQHIADVIVHGWDVAVATGQEPSFDPGVTLDALEWAKQNLRPEFRGGEASGKSFGPEVEVAEEAPPLDRLVGFFGRDPAWSPNAVLRPER
jgi:uncharacterized protein (TIGR03086 family)